MSRWFQKVLSVCLALAVILTTMPLAMSVMQAAAYEEGFYSEYDGVVYWQDDTTFEATVVGYTGEGDTVVIPDVNSDLRTVTAIADGVFANCETLTSLTLPYTMYTVGEGAFAGCDNLQTVTYTGDELSWDVMRIADGNEALTSAAREYTLQNRYVQDELIYALYPDKTATLMGPRWFSDWFLGIPETVWYDEYTVTAIAANAFFGEYSAFYTVYLPRTITHIGENAFATCGTVDRVMFFGSPEEWYMLDIANGNDALVEAHLYFEGTEFVDDGDASYALLPDGTAELISIGTWEQTVRIPDEIYGHRVTYIYENAFAYTNDVMWLDLPAVEFIGENAFAWCYNLQTIVYGGSEAQWNAMTVMGGNEVIYNTQVFFQGTEFSQNDTLFYAVMPDQTVQILGDAGGYSTLVIPETIDGYPVTSIGRGAFRQCEHIEEVIIEASLTYIGEYAFDECSHINSVIHADSEAEWQATTVDEGNSYLMGPPQYFDVEDMVTEGDMTFLLRTDGTAMLYRYGPTEYCQKVVIPATVNGYTVTVIGPHSFCGGCDILVLPASLRQIEEYAFGDGDFIPWVCYAGTQQEWYDNVTVSIGNNTLDSPERYYEAIDVVFDNGIQYVIGTDGEALVYSGKWCYGDVLIPDTINGYPVTKIHYGAFYGNNEIESVIICDSVHTIGMGAFMDCARLSRVVLSSQVTYIDFNTFAGCSSLTTVNHTAQLMHIGGGAFQGTALESFKFDESMYYVGSAAFCDCPYLRYVWIASPSIYIEEGAFENSMFMTVVFSGTEEEWEGAVSGIDPWYYVCVPEARDVVVQDQILYVLCQDDTAVLADGRWASWGEVTIPATVDGCEVVAIANSAFENCYALDQVIIPDTVTSIGRYAFAYTWLQTVIIPDSVTKIAQCAFVGCEQLTSVTLGKGLTTVEYGVFEWCKNLASVTIPSTVTYIGEYMFSGCDALSDVYYDDTIDAWECVEVSYGNEPLEQATIHTKLKSGDLDGDNEVTTSDARSVLSCAIGMQELTSEQIEAADYNKDGKVNSADARRMLIDISLAS